MNEPFLLSNLIDLQDLDNEIFKLIAEKTEGESVSILKELEINYHENNSLLNKKKEDLSNYFEEKKILEQQIHENNNKLNNILEKLQNPKLDAGELQNFSLQKSNVENNIVDLNQSIERLNDENSEELLEFSRIEQSLQDLKPDLIEFSKKIQSEWKDLDSKITELENKKFALLDSFPGDIKELYDRLKLNGVEVIAAYKNVDQCGCCGVSLTSSELDLIADSEYNQCPYCQGVVI